MNLKARVTAGFAVLCILFVALISLQFVVGDRLQARHEERAARFEGILDANRSVLQYMTDAETGVRGFQLTGDQGYLTPYHDGRQSALAILDRLGDTADSGDLPGLVEAERQAAWQWLYAYAIPVVNAGTAGADIDGAARGKQLFQDIRTANARLTTAVEADRAAVFATDRRDTRRMQLAFGLFALLVLLTGLTVALLHQRHLLGPLEHIRHTLRRLADGDLSARAQPTGPGEMRAVAGTLNDLAAETERLITAEQARTAASELRQRIAAVLRSEGDPIEIGRRVARMIAGELDAEAGYGLIAVGRDTGMTVSWPPDAPELDPELIRTVRAGTNGVVRALPGGLAVALSADAECQPGVVLVTRPGRPEWTPDERHLLGGLAHEIDHAVRQERFRLRQARLISELRVLDEQKNVFIATVTHELRTPLTSILGYSEMLTADASGELTPMQERALDAIQRNGHRLQATVSDLLLLDRAGKSSPAGESSRAGKSIGLPPEPVDLAATLTAVHDELAAAARAKSVESVLDAGPVWVSGDGPQLERALRKLVDNAIKFTPAGGRIELRLAADGPDAVVTVTDTGMGIPADDLPGLFTPFHRATNAMDQAVQGPGLGLAVVRNIVAEHGGSITARSEVGRGSTFTVTLPMAAVATPAHG